MYVRLGNVEYDITNFDHPGGSVIKYNAYEESLVENLDQETIDSTNTFREFHYRSKLALKYLKTLPRSNVECYDRDTMMLKDFDRFRISLEECGFFEPSMFHMFYRFFEIMLMFYLSYYSLGRGYKFMSWLVASLVSGRCGWLMHEAGHNSLVNDIGVNKHIQKMLIGFGLWTSGSMWNSMHNKHHASPQKENYDMDLDTVPFVAFYKGAVEASRRGYAGYWSSLWFRLQAYTFLPLTSGVFVMLFWVYYLHPRKMLVDRDYEQMFYVLLGHVGRASMISYVTGWGYIDSYLFLMLQMMGAGMYLFGNFALSHTTTPVISCDDMDVNWVEYAFDHTVDIDPEEPLINWFMGYLNCQVVHHLFPSMPQFRQPEVSRRLSIWAKKWGIKYKIVGYWRAVWDCFMNLNDVGRYYFSGCDLRKKE